MNLTSLPPFVPRRGCRLNAALLTIVVLACALFRAGATQEDLRQHLLIVYNKNALNSEKLARYYAEKRQIPDERLLGIDCPDQEEIDRRTYEDKISGPIGACLIEKGWIKRQATALAIGPKTIQVEAATENEIWVIVLIRGIPLKIQNDSSIKEDLPLQPALSTNAASVDSELATLPTLGTPLTGPILNAYYFSGYARDFDAQDARKQILVARLDAPVASEVRRMIDESLSAEANRLTGYACIDARGLTDKNNPYSMGDEWMRNTLITLNREGWPIEFDNRPELIPANSPITQVALYAGWYTENAEGPFFQPPRRFSIGAIAYHLHSYSAATLHSRTAHWCGPLISAGAAATMGCVYEPYLDLTPHIDIFFDRLLQGYTFAEAAYMSQKVLSWMTTMVGDPLYRPFREKLPQALENARKEQRINTDWLELQQANLNFQHDPTAAPLLKKQFLAIGAGDYLWEGYGDLLSRENVSTYKDEIIAAYKQSMKLYFGAIDQIRIGIKLSKIYVQTDQKPLALAILKQLLTKWPREAAYHGVEQELSDLNRIPLPNVPPEPAPMTDVPVSNQPTVP
jgi:uncharacterized protein (TIGR03790 family)